MQIFDLTSALSKRTISANTIRAYYRWVDRYLVDLAGLKPTRGDARNARMQQLAASTLQRHLTPRKLRRWLERLAREGQGRQGLDQARASIVTLGELLYLSDMLGPERAQDLHAVRVPAVARNQGSDRLLNSEQLKQIMAAARDMASSPNQLLRNQVVATMLCTMALRREELSSAKWGDISLRDGRVILRMGEGASVDIPAAVLTHINRWRGAIASKGQEPMPESPLIRRIWKGGRVAKDGLSPDGIWLIVRDSASYASLGHVTPDDLRRSAVARLRDAGVSVEEISRLLRHRNTMVTERFLAKLPLSEKVSSEDEA